MFKPTGDTDAAVVADDFSAIPGEGDAGLAMGMNSDAFCRVSLALGDLSSACPLAVSFDTPPMPPLTAPELFHE